MGIPVAPERVTASLQRFSNEMPFYLLYTSLGASVGFIVGLTGVGGGSLMTPALVLLLGIHPATAVGTDLLYAATTKSVGSIVHALKRNVAWRVVALLSLGSIPATIATSVILARFGPQGGLPAKAITIVLGLALLLTSVLLFFRRWLLNLRRLELPSNARRNTALTILTGAVMGFLVSISSVGAGAIGVTALVLLYPTYSTVRIVGTDIAHAVPLTLVASAGHWLMGAVDTSILLSLLAGSIPGIIVGSYLAPHVPEQRLRYILAAVLLVVGVKLVAS